MSLSKTYRFFAICMALVMLFSTSGLTMDMHFCNGKLKRVNFFGAAKTCAEVADCMKRCGKKIKSCHSNKISCSLDDDNNHKGCCENESAQMDMDYDYSFLYDTPSDHDNKILASPSYFTVKERVIVSEINYNFYRPPPLIRAVPQLYQVFRL